MTNIPEIDIRPSASKIAMVEPPSFYSKKPKIYAWYPQPIIEESENINIIELNNC